MDKNDITPKYLRGLPWKKLIKNGWLSAIKNKAASTDEQINLILFAIKPSEKLYEVKKIVVQEVRNLIQQSFGDKLMVIDIGSASNGLALKNSDVDIIAIFYEVFEDESMTVMELLLKVQNCIKSKSYFKNVELIESSALRKIQFKSLNIQFVLTCTEDILLYRSRFIQKLVGSEEKIKNLIIILKFWVKRNINATTIRTTALCYLILFYFQQQLGVSSIYECINRQCKPLNGWYVEIKGIKGLDGMVNDMSIVELLRGFFSYYSAFDFKSYVICPYIGKPMLKEHINVPCLLPDGYEFYKWDLTAPLSFRKNFAGELCIQDPFVHHLNATEDVDKDLMNKLKRAFEQASHIFSKNDNNFFYELFTSKYN